MILGVHPVWVFFFYALDLIYQFFIHTETVGKFSKWVEYVFDTPSNHRAHHGTNGAYIDQNYGGVLIIFDRWFGTYVEEDTVNNPVKYGAVGEDSHDHIIGLIFGVFYRMWQRFFRVKGIKKKLKVLFYPPSATESKTHWRLCMNTDTKPDLFTINSYYYAFWTLLTDIRR